MSEHQDTDQDMRQDTAQDHGVATGNPQVDDVLRTLDSLTELPVDQHVAVFEAAHVGLRDALSGAAPTAPR